MALRMDYNRARRQKDRATRKHVDLVRAQLRPTGKQRWRLDRELEENPDADRTLTEYLNAYGYDLFDLSRQTYTALLTWLIEREGSFETFPLWPPEEEGA